MAWGTMRLGILSDVHSNLPALEAVLADAAREGVAKFLSPGDHVGYNPYPNEVLDRLRSLDLETIRGNHDRATVSGETLGFHSIAAMAVEWTREHLASRHEGYLRSLPPKRTLTIDGRTIVLCHGSPDDEDEYLYPEDVTAGHLERSGGDILLLGHTHVPMVRKFGQGLVINPGSVGQPRDGEWRASWAILETEPLAVRFRRVEYPVVEVQERIRDVGLPAMLAERLGVGL